MKLTLLELVQNILSAMDSEEVNSISDTTESRQVAEVVRTAYYNILSRAELPEHKRLFNLDPSVDLNSPALMYRPDNVNKIEWIKYNKSITSDPQYEYVTILPIQQFLDMVHNFDPDLTEIESLTINDHVFYYKNNVAPEYCTILQDYIIVFDSYNSDVDSTLQASKSMCYGLMVPSFSISDSFTPDLDAQQFPLLLNEAKSLAFMELKQTTHDGAILEARRQWRSLQRNKKLGKENFLDQAPDFGRK